jgi:putative oxidoreductase
MRAFVLDRCNALLKFADALDWLGPLVVRLFFGYFWLETGWAKLHNLAAFTERFINWGIPFPAFSAALSASTEFIGGGLIMIGLLTRLTAIPMIINMVVAIALVVIKNVSSFDDFVELDEFVYILIFFWLLTAGPGKVSVDTLVSRRLRLWNR